MKTFSRGRLVVIVLGFAVLSTLFACDPIPHQEAKQPTLPPMPATQSGDLASLQAQPSATGGTK